jgi:hypothetical protein
MLVEAAWAAVKTPGPLRAFYERGRARRGMQVAVVAAARKLATLCWHLVFAGQDCAFARPSLADSSELLLLMYCPAELCGYGEPMSRCTAGEGWWGPSDSRPWRCRSHHIMLLTARGPTQPVAL